MVYKWYPAGDAFSIGVKKRNLLVVVVEKGLFIQMYARPAEFICIIIKDMTMVTSDRAIWDRFPLMDLRASKGR